MTSRKEAAFKWQHLACSQPATPERSQARFALNITKIGLFKMMNPMGQISSHSSSRLFQVRSVTPHMVRTTMPLRMCAFPYRRPLISFAKNLEKSPRGIDGELCNLPVLLYLLFGGSYEHISWHDFFLNALILIRHIE